MTRLQQKLKKLHISKNELVGYLSKNGYNLPEWINDLYYDYINALLKEIE